jgi:hypothetical protein
MVHWICTRCGREEQDENYPDSNGCDVGCWTSNRNIHIPVHHWSREEDYSEAKAADEKSNNARYRRYDEAIAAIVGAIGIGVVGAIVGVIGGGVGGAIVGIIGGGGVGAIVGIIVGAIREI